MSDGMDEHSLRDRAHQLWGDVATDPADDAELRLLERQLRSHPDRMLAEVRGALGEAVDQAEAQRAIDSARRMAANRDAFLSFKAAELGFLGSDERVPPDFTFPGMTESIRIDPSNRRFETAADGGNYVLHWLRARTATALRGGAEPFRWAEDHPSNFVYDVHPTGEGPPRVGLFGDFGNGLYASRYVAKHLADSLPDVTVHLGDVYYAGTEAEIARAYDDPVLQPLLQRPFFAMNGNHEMYSGGKYYLDFLDRKRGDGAGVQEQEGTYFCLRLPGYQVIGLDTAYWKDGRHAERRLQDWLHERLLEGRESGSVNVLLSPNEPYHLASVKYLGLGSPTGLLQDVQREIEAKLIDLWFWGNVHYNALFHPAAGAPFVGSCIGHGGYPYKRISRSDLMAVGFTRAAFVETAARFPAWTGLRQDMGNNGFCVMTLHPDGVELTYSDWMRRTRCHVRLPRNGARLTGQIVTLEHCVDGANDCRRLS